jgi:hypothetical protein
MGFADLSRRILLGAFGCWWLDIRRHVLDDILRTREAAQRTRSASRNLRELFVRELLLTIERKWLAMAVSRASDQGRERNTHDGDGLQCERGDEHLVFLPWIRGIIPNVSLTFPTLSSPPISHCQPSLHLPRIPTQTAVSEGRR